MKIKAIHIFFVLFGLNSSIYAQDWADEKEETEQALFFAGVNVGILFPNDNTSIIYTGANDVTPYGVNYILSVPSYQATFDAYFEHPYYLAELPLNPAYKNTLDLGLHAGLNLGGGNTVFFDINYSTLNYEQFFTIAIDDPNNQSPEPTYEQLPIIGKENRFNFNLGTQLALINEGSTTVYWAFFGNFNSIAMQENYIVINNREYQIIHSTPQQPNVKPGGIGYGLGTGAGFKLGVIDHILVDLAYNLYYIKTKMNDNIQPFGIHHGITFRIIWN